MKKFALFALLALAVNWTVAPATLLAEPTSTSPTASPSPREVAPEGDNGAAVTPTPTPSPTGQGGGGDGGLFGGLGSNWMLIVMFGGLILLYIWMGRSRRKQEHARKQLLSSLKKGDRITTIGGIIGTIVEVRDNDVTVKTDDNTRMKFARWAIRDVGEPKGDVAPDDKK